MIRGLRFTIKGGPGSGHHGHSGVPGSVGGSAPGGRGGLTAPEVIHEGINGNIAAQRWLSISTSETYIAEPKRKWGEATLDARAELKAKVARDLSKETGISEEECSEFVEQWAHSSNDDDMRSLAIQQDASDEFGVELSEFTKGKINRIEQREISGISSNPLTKEEIIAQGGTESDFEAQFKPFHSVKFESLMDSPTQRKVLRAMYNKTQSELKARGITEVRAYRGAIFSVDEYKGIIKGFKNVNIKTNPLSSWSLSQETASGFATGAAGQKAKRGVTFSSVIPASRILSLPTTGFGCLTEGELVVLGGKNDFAEITDIW